MYKKILDLKRLEYITKMIELKSNKSPKILDVGCGNGHISIFLGERNYKVLGVDISPKAIEIAKMNNRHSNVRFEQLDANEFKLSSYELFDVIVCSEVVEHLQKPADFLNSVKKYLVKDGLLIITVPNGFGPREALVTKPVQKIYKNGGILKKILNFFKKGLGYSGETIQSAADDLSHIQFFSKKSLTLLASKTGFKIIDFSPSIFISEVFPFSWFANRILFLQVMDSKLADLLPVVFSSGFLTLWKRKSNKPA